MAHLQRLIFCACVALLSWLPGSSFATITPTGMYATTNGPYVTDNSYTYTDPSAVCLAMVAGMQAANGPTYTVTMTSVAVGSAGCKINNGNSGNYSYGIAGPISTCPANSTGTTTCTCSAGYVDSGSNSCISNSVNTCNTLNASGNGLAIQTNTPGLHTCYNGILVTATGAAFGTQGGAITSGELYGPFTCGASCTGVSNGGNASASSPSGNPAASTSNGVAQGQCPTGQYWGTVNGVGTCVPSVSSISGGSGTSASAAGGSTSAPTSGLGANAPPTATQSTNQTTCSGGNCTTTTTYQNGSGTAVGTTTSTVPLTTYCAQNPTATGCPSTPSTNTDTFSAAACGSPPACSGDAIACATATAAWQTQCDLTVVPTTGPTSTEITAYNAALAGPTGDQTLQNNLTTTTNISSASFDQTNILGAGAGVSDVTVAMPMGGSVTLPLHLVNSWLSVLGNVLMAVTFLVCLKIVGRGQ